MKKIFLIFLIISLIGFSSAQLGIFGGRSNSNVINLQSVNVSSSGGGSGNVTSVSSGDACIFVSPTTGDVVVTFNTSCDTNSGGVISNSSLNAIYRLKNETINQNNISNFFNNLVTSSIGNATYQPIGISFNQSEFNFIQNLTAYTCSVGLVVQGVNSNGTVKCIADANSGAVISNASLNAIYLNLSGTNANQNINVGIYNITSNWFKGLFNWIVGANPSQRYLTFNGSTLDFSETNLNQTIDRRATNNASWNESYADTLYADIQWNYNQTRVNSVSATGVYLIINPTTGDVVGTINETKLNNTIDNRALDSSEANTTYVKKAGDTMTGTLRISNNGNLFINSTGNSQIGFEEFSAGDTAILMYGGDIFNAFSSTFNSHSNLTAYWGLRIRNNGFPFNDIAHFGVNADTWNWIASNTCVGKRCDSRPSGMLDVNGTIIANNYINSTIDVCITGGKCLNQTITLSSPPAYNNTMAYWNNDTRTWNFVPEAPTNNEALVYCNSGATPRLTWIDKDSGACPL